jgi:WD40 repeat protein
VLTFSKDGKNLFFSDQKTLQLWNIATGQKTPSPIAIKGLIARLYFTPDGKFMFAQLNRGVLEIWDFENAKKIGEYKSKAILFLSDLSRDGKVLALTGDDKGTVKLLDPGKGTVLKTLSTGLYSPDYLSFTPDSKRLIYGYDYLINVKDLETGQDLAQPLQVKFIGMTLSPNGREIATIHDDGSLKIWEIVG